MARNKIDPAISRKAYADATKALKEKHSGEFADLLDKAYEALEVESPRQRSLRLANEAQEKKDAAEAKRQARQAAKIEEAKALLEAAGLSVIPGTENAA
jgi:hypothetical protein